MKFATFIFAFGLIFETSPVAAEVRYVAQDAKISVNGTSTLHDWVMLSKEIAAHISVREELKAPFESRFLDGSEMVNVSVSLKAESLKSESDGLNENAYKTLKTEKFPNISYVLKSLAAQQSTGGEIVLNALGTLSVAGNDREIEMQVVAQPTADGQRIVVRGKKGIKFSDFQLERPSAMFGAVKAGENLELSFEVTFKKQ